MTFEYEIVNSFGKNERKIIPVKAELVIVEDNKLGKVLHLCLNGDTIIKFFDDSSWECMYSESSCLADELEWD